VLLSAVDTLKKHQPYVVVEFEEANLKRMRSRVGTVELVKHVRESMQVSARERGGGRKLEIFIPYRSKISL
jgi:hypothetical protein